jgi:undecaprenyl-diphosphatase
MGVETAIVEWFAQAHQSGVFIEVVKFFSTYLIYAMGAAVIVLWWREEGERKKAYTFGFTVLLMILARGIITEVIRMFYHRPRPFEVLELSGLVGNSMGNAFPSGHTVVAFAIALLPLLFGNKKWTYILSGVALLVGVARVATGVHWPTDIIGGALVAGASFVLLYYVIVPPRLAHKFAESEPQIETDNKDADEYGLEMQEESREEKEVIESQEE